MTLQRAALEGYPWLCSSWPEISQMTSLTKAARRDYPNARIDRIESQVTWESINTPSLPVLTFENHQHSHLTPISTPHIIKQLIASIEVWTSSPKRLYYLTSFVALKMYSKHICLEFMATVASARYPSSRVTGRLYWFALGVLATAWYSSHLVAIFCLVSLMLWCRPRILVIGILRWNGAIPSHSDVEGGPVFPLSVLLIECFNGSEGTGLELAQSFSWKSVLMKEWKDLYAIVINVCADDFRLDVDGIRWKLVRKVFSKLV